MSDDADKAANDYVVKEYANVTSLSVRLRAKDDFLAGYAAAQTWRPIEGAPRDQLVVVRWRVDDGTYHDFDTLTEEGWERHEDSRQHAECVAPAGSRIPPVNAPYTNWMPLPLPPSE